MKEQDKIMARDLNEMEINMSNREVKVMIINTLTKLEKRVENISESLNN